MKNARKELRPYEIIEYTIKGLSGLGDLLILLGAIIALFNKAHCLALNLPLTAALLFKTYLLANQTL